MGDPSESSTVVDSPGEQRETPAISREGLSRAADVLRAPDNSGDAGVPPS